MEFDLRDWNIFLVPVLINRTRIFDDSTHFGLWYPSIGKGTYNEYFSLTFECLESK